MVVITEKVTGYFFGYLCAMNKYERLKADLDQTGTGKMKAFGNSMLPIIKSGSLLTYQRLKTYEKGHIVFCKVKGRYIDAHLVKKKDGDRYLIVNNHGYENGWTNRIYGKVIAAEHSGQVTSFTHC